MMVIRALAPRPRNQITKYCHVASPHTSRASFTPCPATVWDVKHPSDDVIADLPAINPDQAPGPRQTGTWDLGPPTHKLNCRKEHFVVIEFIL